MFTDNMPEAHSTRSFTVLRAKAGAPIVGVMAGQPVRCLTHYYRKRTLPCVMSSNQECPLCMKGHGKRYYAYYPIQSGRGTIAVVELTASSEATLTDYLKQKPPMSLPVLSVRREAGKKNNPVQVSVDFRHVTHEELDAFGSKTVDKDLVKRTLCKLWSLPPWEPGCNEDEFAKIVASYLRDLIEGHVDV